MTTTPKFSRLDPAQRRDQILDAANALFAERSFDEVSVEDIANAAGVTRGLVHHYFGGRKEVYIALLERLVATMGRGEDIADPEVRRVVAELLRRAIALVAAHHADIAEDSPRLRYALECWTGLQPRRDATLAQRRGHPRRDTRTARLDAGARLAHVRRSIRAKQTQIAVLS
jgi:AcrR family transcriptional regulator